MARYIGTPILAKHRLFVWLDRAILPDHQLVAIARDDDYTLGVLHSRAHEVWALGLGTQLETRPRYTPTTCFETFPFPDPTPEQRARVGEAARRLVELRDGWLNPPGLDPAELAKRTLTHLYNQRPTWLANAHADLDAAVFAAYGWPSDLPDAAILERLLAMNLDRAALEGDPDVERMAFRAALPSMPAGGADEDFAFGRDVPRPSEFA
jgi:type II restriction/modification system DNA methylase subunit YeeA